MSENTLQPFQPVLYFISKIFILVGMVLIFTFAFMGVGMFLSKYIFGVDVIREPSLLNEFGNNIYVLRSLKLIQVLNTIGGFLLPAILFSRALQQKPNLFIRYAVKPRWTSVIVALLIMLISSPLISALIQWNEAYKFPAAMADLEYKLRATQTAAEELTAAFIKTENMGGLLLNLFIVALLPAVCEEFFFRGAFMRFLMICIKNKHISVMLTALVFSVMHGEFYGLLPRFVLGLFLGYIAWFSGSIWPAVAAHFLNNGLALTASYYHWDQSGIAIFDEHFVFPKYAVVLSAGLTAGLIWWMRIESRKALNYNGE